MPTRRPQPQLVFAAASDAEAAAVIAAVEQFLRETTVTATAESRPDPWLRAALLEQTSREPDGAGGAGSWGDAHPW